MENNQNNDDMLLDLTTDVVAAYVGNNAVATSDLTQLIRSVHETLSGLTSQAQAAEAEKPKPAVPVKKSITEDYIICLEDGKPFKSLKRHLKTHYDLSPDQYRERWGLPSDYPMVAPSYAKKRSELAKQMRLGQKRS